MWGIVPAAGRGSRIQPLAFSKELLPVGSRRDNGNEKPVAVAEHLLDRMVAAGVDKIAMVISPEKTDILEYFRARWRGAQIFYVVQTEAAGLCDAIFTALPLIEANETVVVGLPDTVWFPETALRCLPRDALSFLLFPVDEPQRFDAVVVDARDRVEAIEVKAPSPRTAWVWGAFAMPGRTLAELHRLWCEDGRGDEYVGTLVNAWLARGGTAYGIKAGERYIDVGTIEGYRAAIAMLQGAAPPGPAVHRAEQEGGPLPVSMEVQT
jgi:glucose-1-phosphate thymidylyltransferase